jgi:hypothetical protein
MQAPFRQTPPAKAVHAVPGDLGWHFPFLQCFLPCFFRQSPFLQVSHSPHAGLHFRDVLASASARASVPRPRLVTRARSERRVVMGAIIIVRTSKRWGSMGQPRKKGTCHKTKHGKKCKKGTCQPTNESLTCENNPCKECRGGTCSNRATIPCENTPCKECRDGTCSNKTNDTSCNGTGKCLTGVCNAQPMCLPFNGGCLTVDPQACCSGDCFSLATLNGSCQKGAATARCLTPTDCVSGSCVGYRCA